MCFVCPSLAVIQVWNPSSSLPFTRLVFTVKLSNHKVMFYNVYRQIAPAAFSARWPCSLHTLGGQMQFCSFGPVFFFLALPVSKGVKRMFFNAPTLIFGFLFSPYFMNLHRLFKWFCLLILCMTLQCSHRTLQHFSVHWITTALISLHSILHLYSAFSRCI